MFPQTFLHWLDDIFKTSKGFNDIHFDWLILLNRSVVLWVGWYRSLSYLLRRQLINRDCLRLQILPLDRIKFNRSLFLLWLSECPESILSLLCREFRQPEVIGHIVPLLGIAINLPVSLLLVRFDWLLVPDGVRLRVVELRIHHVFVPQKLVVRVVYVVIPFLDLRLDLRCLTAG